MYFHCGYRKSDHRRKVVSLDELGISRTQSARWQREASLPEDEFQEYLQQTRLEGRELTTTGLLRMARIHARTATCFSDIESSLGNLKDRLRGLARWGSRFACIYVDPPWPGGRGVTVRRFERELAALPVQPLAAKEAHLHLWVMPELLECGLKLLRAWGFHYRASLAKSKQRASGSGYWQQAHEVLMLGVRGGLPFRDPALPSAIDGSSTSCPEIHAIIERASHPPYLDLFGSEALAGWTVP